jgi:porin
MIVSRNGSGRRSLRRSGARSLLWGLSLVALCAQSAHADINPWVAARVYEPKKWDTAGPYAATRWLHPTARPDEGWGIFDEGVFRTGRWRDLRAATGSWGEFGEAMQRHGVDWAVAYFGQLESNPVGGERQGTSYKQDIAAALFLDLERLAGWQGSYFTSSFDYKPPAQSLSTDFIGNQFPVQLGNYDDHGATRLVHLAFSQQLLDNQAEFVVGRIITGEDFANLRLACTSLNQAICSNPINAAQNISFPTYPNAVWGGRVKVQPGDTWYAQAGSYLVYEGFGDSDLHGVEFSAPAGSGALTIAEVGTRVGSYRARSGGLPGTYKLGGYYDGQRLEDVESQREVSGTWGIYALAEQMLYREDDGDSQGLSAFGALSYAPPERNPLELMAAGGLSYQGLVSGRDHDALAFVFAYGQYGADLRRGERARGEPTQTYEVLLELNYRITLAPWLFVQPDLQGIIRPSGKGDIDNALVVGFAVGVVL